MTAATLTLHDPRNYPGEGTPLNVVGGVDALDDASDSTYAEVYSDGGTSVASMLADVAGTLPTGAVPTEFRLVLRATTASDFDIYVEFATDIETNDYTLYFGDASETVPAGGPAEFTVTMSATGADPLTAAVLASDNVQVAVYRGGGAGTLRIHEARLEVDYVFVSPERVFNLNQTRDVEYARATTASQPWALLAAEGATTVSEPVVTGQFLTTSTTPGNYDFILDASESYTFNGPNVGKDVLSANLRVKRFQSEPDPLPRTVRLRLYAHWLYNDGGVDLAGGSWDVYVLASTDFNPANLLTTGSDVSSYWFAPGSLGTWTTMATLTATGASSDQASPRPSWLADYGIDTAPTVTHFGTIDGQPYADVEFDWSGAGNLSVCVVDDYWLSGTAPSFPAGDTEDDESVRRITAYVDAWVHTGSAWPLHVVDSDGTYWRVGPDSNPDGGIARLVEADGTRWVQDVAGTRPLTVVDAEGAVLTVLPMSAE